MWRILLGLEGPPAGPGSWSSRASPQSAQSARVAAELFEHRPSLFEIPEHLVDVGHRGAAPGRDAPAATAIDQPRSLTLRGRHAGENRLEAAQAPRVGRGVRER